jgi:hypothetical protein
MQKLVLRYHWYTLDEASGDVILPFEYESKEQAFVDFNTLRDQRIAEWDFEFLGQSFNVSDTEDVHLFTLEEWFERYKLKN